MTLTELTLYATVMLGVLSTGSARIAYADGAPRVQQESQAYYPSFLGMQEIKDQEYSEEQEFYVTEQQERCLGEQKQITNLPFVKGDICSVTQNQCGWVKFNVMERYLYRFKHFLRYFPDAGGQIKAEFRVCKRGNKLCYRNIHNDCSGPDWRIATTPVYVPSRLGNTMVMVLIKEPARVCLGINIPKCP